jgi:phosphonate transport system permease protein
MSDDRNERVQTDGGTASAGDYQDDGGRIEFALERIERAQLVKRILTVGGLLAVLAITTAGVTFLGFTLANIVRQLPSFFESIVAFLTPDFHFITLYATDNGFHGLNALVQSLLNPMSFLESVTNRDQGLTIVGHRPLWHGDGLPARTAVRCARL